MKDIKTVTLDGGELKVEGLGGQNTVIVNRGSATLYASVSANVTPDGDNTAAIPAGGVMNLYGTNGTVYLLGTGKVELEGTDYADIGRAAVVSSGGGSSGGGVSKEYVDGADAETLSSAEKYTDDEIAEVEGKIPVIPEALPADGGNAETAERLATPRTINGVEFDGSKDIEIDAVTQAELADLKGYIGYTDSDIYGLEADFENNKFTRLAGAVGKNPGADFDSVNAFGGRRRCTLHDDGTVNKYYPDEDSNDGFDSVNTLRQSVMVEQPKFYYKVVPLKTEKIDGADGYHLRKARYYISDTPKAGFKVHPAFVQNGVEVDKIYLSAYEGSLGRGKGYYLDDEQIAEFDTDVLCSIPTAKPASGTTQALTRANALKLAQNRGAGWGITTIQTLSATQLLFAIEYATFNSQAAIGNGVVDATETIKTGSTSSLGNASGSVESGGVSYRGEENLWGNIYHFVDDIYFDNNEGDDHSLMYISGNENPVFTLKANIKFPSAFQYIPERDWLLWASEFNGNSSFLTGDLVLNSLSGTSLGLMTGGKYSTNAVGAGMFCDSVYALAHSSDRGARLIYIPQPAVTQKVTAND